MTQGTGHRAQPDNPKGRGGAGGGTWKTKVKGYSTLCSHSQNTLRCWALRGRRWPVTGNARHLPLQRDDEDRPLTPAKTGRGRRVLLGTGPRSWEPLLVRSMGQERWRLPPAGGPAPPPALPPVREAPRQKATSGLYVPPGSSLTSELGVWVFPLPPQGVLSSPTQACLICLSDMPRCWHHMWESLSTCTRTPFPPGLCMAGALQPAQAGSVMLTGSPWSAEGWQPPSTSQACGDHPSSQRQVGGGLQACKACFSQRHPGTSSSSITGRV